LSIYDSNLILIYCSIIALVLGACLGSFLNCTAIRIARGENFVKGRSHCMYCGHDLSALDLVPVLSWVFLRGRCRYCHEKISPRYVIVEIVFAIVTLACLLRFDLTVLCLRNEIYLCVLLLLSLVDLETMIIPDRCHIIMVAAWVLSAPLLYSGHEIFIHVLAGVIFGVGVLVLSLVMDKVLGRESMGGGDIKLLAVTGLYFGIVGTLFVLILSCIIGLVFNILHRGNRAAGSTGDNADRNGSTGADADRNGSIGVDSEHMAGAHAKTGEAVSGPPAEGAGTVNGDDNTVDAKAFPFGPWIALASAIVLFAGQPLIDWYLGLMG